MTDTLSIPYILGGFIVSFAIAFLVYGTNIAQAWAYLYGCDEDSKWSKWLAGIIIFLETVQSCVLIRELYCSTVLTIADPINLFVIDWSVPCFLIFDCIIGTLIDGFYIHRIWTFSKNMTLTAVTTLLLIAWNGCLLYVVAGTIRVHTWTALETARDLKIAIIFGLSSVTAIDLIIAGSMVYYLRLTETAFQGTRDVITWLIIYSVNTGVVLVAISLASLITYLVLPNNFIFLGFILILSKVYASCLFGALNTRHTLRNRPREVSLSTQSRVPVTRTDAEPIHTVRVEIRREVSKFSS